MTPNKRGLFGATLIRVNAVKVVFVIANWKSVCRNVTETNNNGNLLTET